PTTLGVDPLRTRLPENEEQPIHRMYGFLYVADKEEGLVIVGDPNLKGKSPGVRTLLDGNPANNFLKRALAFNPNGMLTGARRSRMRPRSRIGHDRRGKARCARARSDLHGRGPAQRCERRKDRHGGRERVRFRRRWQERPLRSANRLALGRWRSCFRLQPPA